MAKKVRKRKNKKINKLKLLFTLIVIIATISALVFGGFQVYKKYKPKEVTKPATKVESTQNSASNKNDSDKNEDTENKKEDNKDSDKQKESEDNKDEKKEQEEPVTVTFTHSEIPYEVRLRMRGKSMPKEDSLIKFSDLSYLTLTYYGFDGKPHIGEMVVNKEIAKETVAIFKELYEKKYPIEKMKLVDDYGADDQASMEDNNTSAFNYRVIAGTDKLSNHGMGLAIDINPKQNPHVTETGVFPKGSDQYSERDDMKKGMIKKYDLCYRAFTDRGWGWGGHWKNPDYQHFETQLDTPFEAQ